MRICYLLLICAAQAYPTLAAPQEPANSPAACREPSDLYALDLLRKKIESAKLYSSWTTEDCLSYFPERCNNLQLDVAIHEKHGGKCAGDSNTWPVKDRFRVIKKTNLIEWYNVTKDKYDDFSIAQVAKKKSPSQ